MVRRSQKTFRKNTSDGTKALKMVKSMKKKIEVKSKDGTLEDLTLSSAGAVFQLYDISQGTDDDEKIGDTVTVKSLQLRYNIGVTSGSSESYIRLVMVEIPDRISVVPAVTDIFESAAVNTLYKKDPPVRYKVLSDVVKHVSGFNAGYSPGHLFGVLRPNVKGSRFHFDGTSAQNEIYLMVLHDGVTETAKISANFRYKWVDM